MVMGYTFDHVQVPLPVETHASEQAHSHLDLRDGVVEVEREYSV